MTFDHELILLESSYTDNGKGDSIPVDEEIPILCAVRSITRSEHYAAATSGAKPEVVFIVNKYEYDGQMAVKFEGKRYKVNRQFQAAESKGLDDFETIELVCEGAIDRGIA